MLEVAENSSFRNDGLPELVSFLLVKLTRTVQQCLGVRDRGLKLVVLAVGLALEVSLVLGAGLVLCDGVVALGGGGGKLNRG